MDVFINYGNLKCLNEVKLAGPWGGVPGLGAMLPYGAVTAMDYAVAAGQFHPRQSPVNPAFTHSWYVTSI